jgi:(S)-citramalyl-CoA lyase
VNGLRSLLFVPGTRPDRFAAALASGADGIIIDLEDAVPIAEKAAARAAALAAFALPATTTVVRCLRINSPRAPDGLRDLLALTESDRLPEVLVVPKVESPDELRLIADVLGTRAAGVGLLPLIESARALSAADHIAAHPRVQALVFGGADLSADLGATMAWEPLLFARSRLVQAAATAGVPAFDVPYLDLANDDGLLPEITAAQRLGFTAKLAIHPKHVAPINAAFTPSAAAVATAERIVAAALGAAGGVCVVDGRMVDAPIVRAAERTLARRPH